MSNAGKNSMRWLETTSTMQAATQAETANNIPSRRFSSSQEESKIVPLKTTTLAVARPTTTTEMFDTAASAGKNSGSDSAAPLVKRITASPGMIKTQIAKISYTYPDDRSPPHSTQKYIKPMTTMIQRIHLENPATPHSAQHIDVVKSSVEDYAQKKSEREMEIREIQEMIEEITKNPPIFNDIQNEISTSINETKNNKSKFKEITNESTTITNDNITNTARTAEKSTPPNTAARAEIATIPAEVDQSAKTTEKPLTSAKSNHIFQKSKTDLNLLPTKAATTRWRKSVREPPNEPRSKSTQPPATKSSELLPGGSPDKKKSYNPQDARRFMEEQRKKRQKNLEFISSHRSQQQKEKEQIKRRLEELRKYSRKVVSKNLTNAQKRTGASTTMSADGGAGSGGAVVDEASPRKTAKLDTIVFKRAQGRKNQQNKNTTKIVKNTETKTAAQTENLGSDIVRKSEVQKETQNKAEKKDGGKPNALMENQKRVGLLRKPEIKDHSFGAIKEFSFDKENVALDLLTPKLTIPVEQARIKDKVMPPTTVGEVKQPADAEPPQPQPNESISMNNLLLEMPEARLHRTRVVREQSTQVRESPSLMQTADTAKESSITQTSAQNERTELPYWLKPSAVQVYPYNFIMAVRRKLEAIANPPQAPTAKISSCGEMSLKLPADTPLSSMSKDINAATNHQNVKRRLMVTDIAEESNSAEFATHSIENAVKKSPAKSKQDAQKSRETPPPPQLLSQTYSDVTSNFSSISLMLPVSNTCSEVSSIKSDSNVTRTKPSNAVKNIQSAEEDNTTVSSSIFNSPDKQKRIDVRVEGGDFKVPRPVSPLSLESIEHLKISSKVKETNIAKRVPQESTEVVEVDFNRLLQDFNRSLSQVIEVNEQLKSTLDKSQQLISPERKHSSNNSTDHRYAVEDEYSTDFEGGSSTNVDFEQIATRVIKKNPLPHHRKNLFELANIVKPLPTSSKSDTGSDATSLSHRKNKFQNLDNNLESMDNSSAENATPSKTKFSRLNAVSSLSSADSLDKRLQSIEQLKNNLRESILISKANRGEIKTDAERLMHNLTATAKEEKQPLLDKPDAVSDDQQSVSKKQRQKQKHTLSNSTIDSHRVSSRRSLLLHSSSEPSDIQTAFSENDAISAHISASAQSADAATMLSASSSSVADKSYTFDSKSNSPKAKTFTITQNAVITTTHSSPAHKSTDLEEDETIAEDLQNIVTTPKKKDNNASALQQGGRKTSNSSADSSPTTSKQGATKATYVKAHINRSRGDFMPAIDDENAVSNESHFQAAAASAAANDTRTDSDSAAPPPSYKAISATTNTASIQQNKFANKSSKHVQSHELITVFNQSDMELSIISSRNGSISETSLNYSSVGLYEKLIQTETTKSEQLTVLLKMREKALLDRTKGQIAWLELQKERYKAKGLLVQITAIKKKQRGILLKMEKEREEIKRLLQSTNSTTSTHSSARHHFHNSAGVQQHHTQTTSPKRKRAEPRSTPPLLLPLPILPKTTRSSSTAQQQQQQKISTVHSAPIIRANYELESSRTLEDLLQKREADLRKRREHVERLILWHQRLDQEEAEVQQLELMLLNYNNVHAQPLNENHSPQQRQPQKQQQQQQTASSDKQQSQEQLTAAAKSSLHKKQGRDAKMERRLKEIDKSLRELSSISVSNNSATSTDESATSDADFVRTSGSKLNKLWRRLTTQQVERFEATRRYKLCKADLERLYEEAKLTVLRDFTQDEHRVAVELLDKTTATVLSQSSLQESLSHEAAEITNNKIVIPRLNLNFSSGQSDPEDAMVQLKQEEESTESMAEAISTHSTLPPTTQGDTYSPCIAEEEFLRQESGSSSSSTSSSYSSQNKDALQVSAESIERHREELLERNVQKFMELTQRFNGAQPGDGLQRSLSDTQIAENCSGVSKKSSNKAAISQRNIAYYGVKTQKRPSKVVNVEIANSLSSASSILTASSTLRSVQSLKTQTFSEANSNSNNYVQHTSNSKPLSANVNNIPLPLSNLTTTTTTTTVASSIIDSLDSCHIGKSKASASAPITSQAKINATPSSTTSLSNVSTAATFTKSDTQAQQISEKLEEISAAVSKLTQSNSLIVSGSSNSTNSKPPSQQQLQINQSTKSSNTEINTNGAGETANTSCSYSYTFELSEPEVTQSHSALESATIVSSNSLLQTQTVPSTSLETPPLNDSSELLSETMLLAKYNADLEDTLDETRLEDISLPQFETTNESTQNEEEEDENDKDEELEQSSEVASTSLLENLSKTTNNLSQVSASLPPPPMPPPPPPPASSSQLPSTSKEAAVTAAATNNNNNNSSSQPQLMPDIINELELRRCQQQIQQYEHVTAVPYNMYVREIPNKPPPPYVPPAHGSPMTTIFPSEERIKDLTYRRTHELYCEILKTEYTNEKGEKLPSVLAEKITNIYERIILDICREYLDENHEVLTESDPSTFHGNLAFFNPPDRLSCLQTFVYKEVRRCLAMDKKQPKRSQVYSVYGQRAKRDHIGKIIIQEMYDEDDKWCNFHHEEAEVLDLIIEEMLTNLVGDIAKEVLLEEGGTVEEVEAQVEEEIVEQNVTNDETIYEDVSLIESTTSALDVAIIATETIQQNSINAETNAPAATT